MECSAWKELRDEFKKCYVEECSRPENLICYICSTVMETDLYRCKDCLPSVIFCLSCVTTIHRVAKLHVVEKWQVCVHTLYIYTY